MTPPDLKNPQAVQTRTRRRFMEDQGPHLTRAAIAAFLAYLILLPLVSERTDELGMLVLLPLTPTAVFLGAGLALTRRDRTAKHKSS